MDYVLRSANQTIRFLQQKYDWNIQVVSVGSAINETAFANDFKRLLDDSHHPNCVGAHLIADMIRHAFYMDMDACALPTTTRISDVEANHTKKQKRQILSPPRIRHRNPASRQLYQTLLRNNTRMGSITAWEPTSGYNKATLLRIQNYEEIQQYPTTTTGKQSASRKDRKYVYRLPLCEKKRGMNIILQEPNLSWLGMRTAVPTGLVVKVNGQWLSKKQAMKASIKNMGSDMVWIPIPKEIEPTNNGLYNISFCTWKTGVDPALSLVVGVMDEGRDYYV